MSKKLIFSGLLLLGGCLHVPQPARAEVYRVDDLAGGINDAVPGNRIADNEAISIVNFHVNSVSRGLDQRRGSSKQNTTQLSGNVAVDVFTHVQSDGDSFLLSVASRTISYSTSNGATWTGILTTATLNAVWDGVSFSDENFYMVNQTDGGRQFTGSALQAVPAMPAGKHIEAYQNRLFVANTAATPYRVFFSGLLQPSTYTTSTDYFDMPEAVTCIGEPFDGGLPIYTKNTTWMLRGSGPRDFSIQQISGQIGCAENRDVQNFEIGGVEYQVFFSLGPNGSSRSLYALLGNRIVDLGRKIPELASTIAIFDSSARIHQWDTDEEFDEGTNSQTAVSDSEEAVKLATAQDTDTTGSEFGAGTLTNVTTQTVSGSLHLSTNENNFLDSDYSSFCPGAGSGIFWTGVNITCSSGDPEITTTAADLPNALGLHILDPSGNVLSSSTQTLSVGFFDTVSFSNSSSAGRNIKAQFCLGKCATATLTTTNVFLASGGNIQVKARWVTAGVNNNIKFDNVIFSPGSGRSTIFNGSFTSAAFDTTFSTAAFLPSGAAFSSNGHNISFQTQESSDGSSWDTAVSWSTGSAPSGVWKRYKRYLVSISTATNGTALPYLDDVTLSVRAATGTYTSDIRDGGTDIASWDIFSANTSGSGTNAFSYRTGATTSAVVAASWNSISPGSDVSGSERYFQWKNDFSISIATHDPTVNSVLQNFSASSGASQPGDMEVWDNDLWMTYTPTGQTRNTSILVMNDEGKFSRFSGLNVYGFTAHNRRLLAGTSINDGSTGGYVYELDTGTTDDGTAVSASVALKDQEFTPMEDYEKNLSLVYFPYAVDQGTFTATISENFSEETTDDTADFDAHDTVARWRLEADPGTVARQFGLSFTNTFPGSRLVLYPPITYHFSPAQLIPQP